MTWPRPFEKRLRRISQRMSDVLELQPRFICSASDNDFEIVESSQIASLSHLIAITGGGALALHCHCRSIANGLETRYLSRQCVVGRTWQISKTLTTSVPLDGHAEAVQKIIPDGIRQSLRQQMLGVSLLHQRHEC